tara:strand:+ start:7018 stop:8232 length:1215 start_codon:yes stop_codon:yes gene_type:complete
MPAPNNGLITENNRQYYEGVQGFIADGELNEYTTTFNTNLVFGSWDNLETDYELNNFKLYTSATGAPGSFTEYLSSYTVVGNSITIGSVPDDGTYIVVQLKILSGGNYGDEDAFGNTVEENYNSYSYISLNDIINNFLVGYVGTGKLIGACKRTDIIFHAKRAMQEFSYDTLRSIKTQELTIPNNLSVVIPQDYVNYVAFSWIDFNGIKHRINPVVNLTINPSEMPVQDNLGVPTQDVFNNNIEADSITEKRWSENNSSLSISEEGYIDNWNNGFYWNNALAYGRRYGAEPTYMNINGYFSINTRENKISFSSDLVGQLIVFEYISDGLAYDLDSRVPKMAEEAVYAYILHAIIATRANQPEYLVTRLRIEKFAKLRNTKIRLSNIKTEEIIQVLRGQSKWIKH